MVSAIFRASVPESRTIPMPPRPGGVDTAAMVSRRRIGVAYAFVRAMSRLFSTHGAVVPASQASPRVAMWHARVRAPRYSAEHSGYSARSSRRTAAAITVAPAMAAKTRPTGSPATVAVAISFRTRPRRTNRLGQGLQLGRHHDHLTNGSFANAFA